MGPEQDKKCTQNFDRALLKYPLERSRRSEDNIKACIRIRSYEYDGKNWLRTVANGELTQYNGSYANTRQ